ncbi:MAG: phage tail protein [Alphaproteobacteria bacterium]|nr:phage tail protein [Alphaproteobacteria bacterium]
MSGLFGKKGVSPTAPVISSLRVSTTCYGGPVPLLYGRNRVKSNVVWYGDFKTTAHQQNQGGKGGGSVSSTSYTYSASFIMAFCTGPVTGTASGGDWWIYGGSKIGTTTTWGLTEFNGSTTQNAWGFMTTNHPSQALTYRGVAYLGGANYNLDTSATLPNFSAELAGQFSGVNVGTWNGGDANPADIVNDLLTNADHGLGISSSLVGDLTAMRNCCIALGIFVSPVYDQQTAARDIINNLAIISNTGIYFSEGVLKFVPRQDFAATGNGTTYTPNLTSLYLLTDDDFLVESKTDDPVKCIRKAVSDAYNTVQINYCDRNFQYNQAIAEAKDQWGIDVYGLRVAPQQLDFSKEIAEPAVANAVAQQVLQYQFYVRNVYEFRLGWSFATLEPMDIVSITDATLGLNNAPVRIISIEEDDKGTLTFQAEELPIGSLGASKYTRQSTGGSTVNINIAPSSVNAPIIFEPPVWLAGSEQIWLATQGTTNWGGCNVWISYDNATYTLAGAMNGPCRSGTLSATLPAGTSNPDTTSTLSVLLNNGSPALVSGTNTDATNETTLCYVDGEYMAYGTATLTGTNAYNLTYLNRALYSSGDVSHSSGTNFVRCDDAVFKLDYDYRYVGKTIYIKLQSFNQYGFGDQDLSTLTPYTFVPQGTAFAFPSPINPQVFYTPEQDGSIKKLKVVVNFNQLFNSLPDGIMLMYDSNQYANNLYISAGGTGSTLTIGSTSVIYSSVSQYQVQAGSTANHLILTSATSPFNTNVNLGGHWWVQTGSSQWEKVTSFDATSIYLQNPLSPAPTVGNNVAVVEVGFADDRAPQWRYAMLVNPNTGAYEIIHYGSISWSAGVATVNNVLRGQEGTTPITADGCFMWYLPAPGPGTTLVPIPLADFHQVGTQYIADLTVDINVPNNAYTTITCAVYKYRQDTSVLRSTIVPVSYGGPL